jgi:hypothetical protein
MKTIALVVLLLIVLALSIAFAQSKPAYAPVTAGRFQIVPAELHSADLKAGATLNEPVVFRLDTTTGETWMFVSDIDEQGKLAEFWRKVK